MKKYIIIVTLSSAINLQAIPEITPARKMAVRRPVQDLVGVKKKIPKIVAQPRKAPAKNQPVAVNPTVYATAERKLNITKEYVESVKKGIKDLYKKTIKDDFEKKRDSSWVTMFVKSALFQDPLISLYQSLYFVASHGIWAGLDQACSWYGLVMGLMQGVSYYLQPQSFFNLFELKNLTRMPIYAGMTLGMGCGALSANMMTEACMLAINMYQHHNEFKQEICNLNNPEHTIQKELDLLARQKILSNHRKEYDRKLSVTPMQQQPSPQKVGQIQAIKQRPGQPLALSKNQPRKK